MPPQGMPRPDKATLDKLESLMRRPEADWRFHADVPHPEDPTLNDSDWPALTVKNVSGPGGENANEEDRNGETEERRKIDRIRDVLADKGILLKDGPGGTTWEVKR